MLPVRKVAVCAMAALLAAAWAVAPAAEADDRAKTQALIRLLVRAGKNDEAAAAMRSLYPKGPPYGGDLALEYYDVIGNTSRGWQEATDGLERLVKAAPEDLSYQLMLARHLSRRANTRPRALQMFASLTDKPGLDRKQVLAEWRGALDKLEYGAAAIAAYKAYLEVDPDNAAIRDSLAGAERAEAARIPWQLRDKADAQLAAGRPREAMETLQRALLLDPKNAWVRFDLARLYHKQGDTKRGREVMEAGLNAAPGDADILYANALFVALLDEADAALRLLGRIPPKERSPAMNRLRRKMEVTRHTQHARALGRAGRRAEMQAAMNSSEAEAGRDPELASVVANAWIELQEPARGVALMRRLASRPPVQKDALIYYAKVLNRAEEYDELASVLRKLGAAKGLTAEDREDLRYLRSSLASHRADDLRQQGKLAEARAALGPALARDPDDTDMLMALARVHAAAGEEPQARDIYQRILRRHPDEAGAQRALHSLSVRASEQPRQPKQLPNGQAGEAPSRAAMAHALQRAKTARAQGDEVGARLAVAEGYMGLGDTSSARTILRELKQRAPDDRRVLLQAGRLARAEGNYEEALDNFRRADAREEAAEIERRRAHGWVSGGIDYLSKLNNVPGISNFTLLELPVEAHVPVGYEGGHVFAQVDPSYANAGALQPADLYNLRQYGKVLALAPGGIASPPGQSARGTALAVGYAADGLRVDLGSTPVGFPIRNVVGGVKWSHYTADTGFSLDISRRPVTSSLVSYAGARDPVTGEAWGGVVSSGAGLHLSRSAGRLTGYVEPGYHLLTGTNVLANSQTALRAGFNWDFVDRADMRVTAGLVGTYWRYRENERFYSFGMGGYYSPQKYFSAAVPARWTGRTERWSYLLQGSVSISVSQEKDMPFYPTSPALQAQAVANSSLTTATYTGGPGHGTGWSLGGGLEYRVTPQWFAGAVGQIDRSAYYTPNYVIVYLRYLFDAHTGPVPFPPEPVKAYSRY